MLFEGDYSPSCWMTEEPVGFCVPRYSAKIASAKMS
jgi:hypothetical protein